MSFTNTLIIIWAASIIPSYFAQRKAFKKGNAEWTISDRRFAILCSIMFAPIILIMGLVYLLILGDDDDRKANW